MIAGRCLKCRLIGVIEAREKKKGKRWSIHFRLMAWRVMHARTRGVKSLQQLRSHTLDDIMGFFEDYNRLHDKRFQVRGTAAAR